MVSSSNILKCDIVCNISQQIKAEQKNKKVYKKSKFSFNVIWVEKELMKKQIHKKNHQGNIFIIMSSNEKLFSIYISIKN